MTTINDAGRNHARPALNRFSTGDLPPRDRLAVLHDIVGRRNSEARLSAKTLARRHGLSDRYVHKLFEESGQTFGQFVQEERLQRALAHLTDPARMGMPISEIAAQAGFSVPSSFNRAFRRRFGDSPGQFRRGRNDDGK
jgi:AraC-like DNA-binding protein